MFMEKCLRNIKNYYRDNPDLTIKLNTAHEYPLFKKDIIIKSYCEFCSDMRDAFSKVSKKWQSWFNLFQSTKQCQDSYGYHDIYKIIKPKEKTELDEFLAFFGHIGFFKCDNPFIKSTDRVYRLPIMFRGPFNLHNFCD